MSLRELKLLIQKDEYCLKVLEYLEANIVKIVQNGSVISIDKISDEVMTEKTKNILIQQGVTRLPALVVGKQVIIGVDGIKKYFNNGQREKSQRSDSPDAEIGSNSDLSSFWEKELFTGVDRRGRHIPRKDKDEPEDEAADIEQKMANYRRNEPRHRKTTSGRERNIEREPRQQRRRPDPDTSDDDNIGSRSPSPPARREARKTKMTGSGNAKDDDMDDRMMDAWLENNV